MTFLVMLRDPVRNSSHLLPLWSGLSCDKGKHGDGSASISFPVLGEGIDQGLPEGFTDRGAQYGWGLDIWATQQRGDGVVGPIGSVPAWSGVAQRCVRRRLADGVVWFDMQFETWVHHILRRRLSVKDDNVPWYDYSGTLYWAQMVGLILIQMTASPSAISGRMNTYPNTRSEWKYFRTTISAAPTAGPQGGIPAYDSGSTVWDHTMALLDVGGLALTCVESRDGSPVLPRFTFGIEYPYTRSTVSGSLVLSDLNSSVAGYQDETDWSTLANVYIERGTGQNTVTDPQYAQWKDLDASVDIYGVHERGATTGAGVNTASLLKKADLEVAKSAYPRTTYNVGLYAMPPGLTLGVDFDVRFPVLLHDSVLLPDGEEQTITGWSASCPGPGQEATVDVTIGDPPVDEMAEILTYVGTSSGRSGGGIERPKGR